MKLICLGCGNMISFYDKFKPCKRCKSEEFEYVSEGRQNDSFSDRKASRR
jgi:predicted  nucleic acid-binding Zn-ribbon protein